MNGLERIRRPIYSHLLPLRRMASLRARPQGLEHRCDYLPLGFPLRLRHRLSVHGILPSPWCPRAIICGVTPQIAPKPQLGSWKAFQRHSDAIEPLSLEEASARWPDQRRWSTGRLVGRERSHDRPLRDSRGSRSVPDGRHLRRPHALACRSFGRCPPAEQRGGGHARRSHRGLVGKFIWTGQRLPPSHARPEPETVRGQRYRTVTVTPKAENRSSSGLLKAAGRRLRAKR